MLAQHDKFLSSSVLPILHDKLRSCITEKRSSWVTCMTDLRVMPDKHDKHEFFQTQTFLQLIRRGRTGPRARRPGRRASKKGVPQQKNAAAASVSDANMQSVWSE